MKINGLQKSDAFPSRRILSWGRHRHSRMWDSPFNKSPLYDHPDMFYSREHKAHVLTLQPYEDAFDPSDVLAMDSLCSEYDLVMDIHPSWSGWWNPGHCALIVIKRQGIIIKPPMDKCDAKTQ